MAWHRIGDKPLSEPMLIPLTWLIYAATGGDKLNITALNSLRPRQNGRHFTDDISKCIFFSEHVWFSLEVSLKVQINNIPSLVQIMTWCQPGDKPLYETMMVNLLMHICITRPQWVKCCSKIMSFNVRIRYFVWNIRVMLWNSTWNILPLHYLISYKVDHLRVLWFNSSYAFLKFPFGLWSLLSCATHMVVWVTSTEID